MRRLITLFALLLCSVSATFAKPFSAGFSAGASYAEYDIEGLTTKSRIGGYAQVDCDIKILFLSLSPELTYRFNQFDVTAPDSYKVKNHSAEASVMAGVTIFKLLTLEVGPRYIYDIKTYAKQSDGSEVDLGALNPEWGYNAGATINISKLRVTARYSGHFERFESCLGNANAHHVTLGIGCRF